MPYHHSFEKLLILPSLSFSCLLPHIQVQHLCCHEGVELPTSPLCYILNPGGITDDLCCCPHQLLFSFCSSSLSLSSPFLNSPPPLCLPAPDLLLKSTEGSNTVAGKGWSRSACQHQTEDRRDKRTSEREREGERERTPSRESYNEAVREATTTFKMPQRGKNTSFTWASWASKVPPNKSSTVDFLIIFWSTHAQKSCGDTHSCSLGLLINTCYASLRSVSHASQGEVLVEWPGAEKWGTVPQILLHQPVSAAGAPAGPLHALLCNPPHPLLCPTIGESLHPHVY